MAGATIDYRPLTVYISPAIKGEILKRVQDDHVKNSDLVCPLAATLNSRTPEPLYS